MKKIIIAMVALISCTTESFAQSTLVATLSHGNDISMFYGAYALKNALEQAESGDIINLSDGAFQASNIEKAVTLRGTGIASARPTYIVNNFNINIPSNDMKRFSMEGIRCTGNMTLKGTFKDPSFSKCQFYQVFVGNYNDFIENVMFANCKITNRYYIYYGTVQFVNCFIKDCGSIQTNSAATFLNCVMEQSEIYRLDYSQFFNCIFYYNSSSTSSSNIPTSSLAYNCIAVNYNNPFRNLVSSPNCVTATYEEVFKNFTGGDYSDDQTFELSDAAKTAFLGTDGTQVGIYGGILPFELTPSYPQFTKMDVSSKTSTDGKLTVDLEVGAGK